MEHMKTPWHVHHLGGSVDIHGVDDSLLLHIQNHTNDRTVFGIVVAAVNAHADLVAACEDVLRAWEASRQLDYADGLKDREYTAWKVAVTHARAALAKAGKEVT